MKARFSKVLVANRGEIAVRIIRACRELGLRSVAVYSDADVGSLHARLADEAVRIGPATASESYLSPMAIIEAARETGAEAVHPGYGFLSENADFAEAVTGAGLVFVGPPAAAIRAMGDKARARAAMAAAGVPVVPGFQGDGAESPSDEELEAAAVGVGYPLLVKARAGGGGRGMRVVRETGELRAALVSARREALHAFGDDGLLLERYIPRARHIEFQVLGDQEGRVVHLLERECSVQRRHQKIIEESPSPLLDEALRLRMGEAAVRAARAAGYHNAGTVEFIVDPSTRDFYFLEMNTRLQVEHPVTEFVAGIDLVRWQFRIAAGEALDFEQSEVRGRGHAIECRLYAEDPDREFLPSSGDLQRYREPRGPGVRVDSGFEEGDTVGLHYDPLIAKISCHAEDRPTALARMRRALDDTTVIGFATNWDFLRGILDEEVFERGEAHTTWIEERRLRTEDASTLAPELIIAAAAAIEGGASRGIAAEGSGGSNAAGVPNPGGRSDPHSPWRIADGFRGGKGK